MFNFENIVLDFKQYMNRNQIKILFHIAQIANNCKQYLMETQITTLDVYFVVRKSRLESRLQYYMIVI